MKRLLLFLALHSIASHAAESTAPKADGVILKEAVLYADTETLKIIGAESDKGGEAGTRALERLDNAGKVWTAGSSAKVRVLQRGGPMGAVMVEAIEGGRKLKAVRFWIMEGDLLPLNQPAATVANNGTAAEAASKAKPSKSVRKADFPHVLNSSISNEIAGVEVKSLIQIVASLYHGDVADDAVKQCLVMPSALGMDSNPCDLVSVTEDSLIYRGVLTVREHFTFAVVREAAFEAGYDDPNRLYQQLTKAGYHEDDPLNLGALIYRGRRKFILQNGLVKMLPTFQVVNVLEQ